MLRRYENFLHNMAVIVLIFTHTLQKQQKNVKVFHIGHVFMPEFRESLYLGDSDEKVPTPS